jgi:hypothetical protein
MEKLPWKAKATWLTTWKRKAMGGLLRKVPSLTRASSNEFAKLFKLVYLFIVMSDLDMGSRLDSLVSSDVHIERSRLNLLMNYLELPLVGEPESPDENIVLSNMQDYYKQKRKLALMKLLEGERETYESDESALKRTLDAIIRYDVNIVPVFEMLYGVSNESFSQDQTALMEEVQSMQYDVSTARYKAQGDTYYYMSWNHFTDVLRRNNFKPVLSEKFKQHDSEVKKNFSENFEIWADTRRGILVSRESAQGAKTCGPIGIHYEIDLESQDLGTYYWTAEELRIYIERKLWGHEVKRGDELVRKYVDMYSLEGLESHLKDLNRKNIVTSPVWSDFHSHTISLFPEIVEQDDAFDQKAKYERLLNFPDDVKNMLGLNVIS